MNTRIKKFDSIRQRLFYLAVIPTLITSLLLGAYFTVTHINDVHENLVEKGNLIASNLSPSVEFGLFSHDVQFLKSLSAPLLSDNDVVSILILDKSRNVVVASISPEYSASELLANESNISVFEAAVFTTRLPVNELIEHEQLHDENSFLGEVGLPESPELTGWVVVKLSTFSAEQRQNEIVLNGLIFIILGVVISGLIAYRMSKNIARPILSLTSMVHEISSGNLDSRSKAEAVGELKLLQQGINSMAETVQVSQQKLEHRVTQSTQELIKTIAKLEQKNTTLNEAQAELISANAAKNEFLAKMSHEIRTPLMTVMGFSGLIENAKSKDDIKTYTRVINRSGTQLLNIIDDILSFSRLEDEQVLPHYEDANVRDVLDDVVSMLAPIAKVKQLSLYAQISNEIPTYLKTDSVKLSQILINLLSNAIKFTEAGYALIRVSLVDTFDDSVTIEIEVLDTGIGVAAQDSEKIFGSFLQAESDRNRSFEGTGLGLAISKKLVDLMGGKIGVDTSVESGSRFWFNLPMKLSDKAESADTYQILEKTIALYDKTDVSRRVMSNTLLSWKANVYLCETFNKMVDLISSSQLSVDVVVISLGFDESTESNVQRLMAIIEPRFKGKVVFLLSHLPANVQQVLTGFPCSIILEQPVPRQRLYHALHATDVNCNKGIAVGLRHENRDDEKKSNVQVANAQEENIQVANAQEASAQKTSVQETNAQEINVQEAKAQFDIVQTNEVHTSRHYKNKFGDRVARILVAEDNEFNSLLIGELLSERGVDSVRVGDAETVLQALEQEHEKFDLLLLDVHMPGMDGLSLATEIRQYHYISKQTPIIAFTADVYVRNDAQLQDCGVNDVLYKPLTDASLDRVLSKWLTDFDFVLKDTGKKQNHALSNVKDKKLLDDVLLHLNNIERSYSVNDAAELKNHFHQLEGMLGYFQLDIMLVKLKELKAYALLSHEDAFYRTLLLLTELARANTLSGADALTSTREDTDAGIDTVNRKI